VRSCSPYLCIPAPTAATRRFGDETEQTLGRCRALASHSHTRGRREHGERVKNTGHVWMVDVGVSGSGSF
jgi:hypothetical protein